MLARELSTLQKKKSTSGPSPHSAGYTDIQVLSQPLLSLSEGLSVLVYMDIVYCCMWSCMRGCVIRSFPPAATCDECRDHRLGAHAEHRPDKAGGARGPVGWRGWRDARPAHGAAADAGAEAGETAVRLHAPGRL